MRIGSVELVDRIAPATTARAPLASLTMAGLAMADQPLAMVMASWTRPDEDRTVSCKSSVTPGPRLTQTTCKAPSGVRTAETWSLLSPFGAVTRTHTGGVTVGLATGAASSCGTLSPTAAEITESVTTVCVKRVRYFLLVAAVLMLSATDYANVASGLFGRWTSFHTSCGQRWTLPFLVWLSRIAASRVAMQETPIRVIDGSALYYRAKSARRPAVFPCDATCVLGW